MSEPHVVSEPDSGDPVVEQVVARFRYRSLRGQQKYGQKMTRTDLGLLDWLRHAEEELMDQLLYLRRAILDLELMQDDGK